MVGETGLEPAQENSHNDLNVARIPIPPLAPTTEILPWNLAEFFIGARGGSRTHTH